MIRPIISKELLVDVLGIEKELELIEYNPGTNELHYYWDKYWRHGSFISMPSLMLKCKKWALKQGYEIMSRTEADLGTMTKANAMFYAFDKWLDEGSWFGAKTEPEAVIKCCEKIREIIIKEK